MNCDETFNAGICYVTDAYKMVCKFNEELHADLEKCRSENAKLRELVRTLHHCAARGECDVCTMRDGRGLDEDTVCFAAHDRMRELGVEVEV